MARGTLEILGARDIASAWDDLRIHDCLRRFAEHYRAEPQLFRSLAVVFAGPDTLDEAAFERAVHAMPAGTPAVLTDPIGISIQQRSERIGLL